METEGRLNIGEKKKEHWVEQHLGYYLVGLLGFQHLWEKVLSAVFKS